VPTEQTVSDAHRVIDSEQTALHRSCETSSGCVQQMRQQELLSSDSTVAPASCKPIPYSTPLEFSALMREIQRPKRLGRPSVQEASGEEPLQSAE
jgi:hypothetical protein